jgi:hypothetical protein
MESIHKFVIPAYILELSLEHAFPEKTVFHWFDAVFPALLVKASDMNPRITKGCRNLVFEIAKAYRRLPFSVLPYVITPFSSHASGAKIEHAVHWRHISCRLQVLLTVLKEYGLDDMERKPKSKHGLKLEVSFTLTV